jgi:hypothetical protein
MREGGVAWASFTVTILSDIYCDLCMSYYSLIMCKCNGYDIHCFQIFLMSEDISLFCMHSEFDRVVLIKFI